MEKVPEGERVLRDTLLREKPAHMLAFMAKGNGPKYVTQISKATDCTYSHVIKLLDVFKSLSLVEFEKKGRIKMVNLTADGKDIAHDLEGILMKIKRVGQSGSGPKKKKKRDENQQGEKAKNK